MSVDIQGGGGNELLVNRYISVFTAAAVAAAADMAAGSIVRHLPEHRGS